MEKSILIGGREVRMRASALIPRLYRFKFQRDIVVDMRQLQRSYAKAVAAKENATDEEIKDAQLSILDLTIFENVAYLMCKQADKNIPDSPEEWLDTIDGTFDIYEALPAILELWNLSQATTSTPAKK